MVSIKKMASAKKNAPSLDLERATSKTWSRTLKNMNPEKTQNNYGIKKYVWLYSMECRCCFKSVKTIFILILLLR